MNTSEMNVILQEKKELLSSKLNRKIVAFIEYANETRPIVKVLSGEDRLKSKLVYELSKDERINVSGQEVTEEFISDENLLYVDYVIVISSVLRVAPIHLTNYLESIRTFNKRCFVVIDNWAMISKTGENIRKIKDEIAKDYPMVDIFDCYMISESKTNGFSTLENVTIKLNERICRLYEETHKNQISCLYKSILKEIDLEVAALSIRASLCQSQLEELRNNLAGIEKANRIKFDNIRDVFNNYSLNLHEDLGLISIEECIKEGEDFSNYSNVRTYASDEYVSCVKKIFTKRNELSLQEYQLRLEKFRDNLLIEINTFYNKVEKIDICDERLLDVMAGQIKEIESVDDIITKISNIVEDGLKDLLRKISTISKRSFTEETGIDESIIEKLKKIAKQRIQEEIDEEEERIKREKIIRNQLDDAIKNANLRVFEETDKFIENMKNSILALSNEVVVGYYSKIEKSLLEMESQIEKRYRSR